MEPAKYFIKIILQIIEKTGPTLATLTAVYLAYRYAKKQKLFENKDEEHKKVRIVTSNLLQIWRELSVIEYYINSQDFFAELIFKNPVIAANYFNIDIKRIKKFKRLFHESKEEIKPLNVTLFYNLENSFMEFNKFYNFFDLRDNEIPDGHDKKILQGILNELARDLENIIKDTATHLPKLEKEKIESIISNHHETLSNTEIDNEVPKFFLDIVNKIGPIKEPITSEELNIVANDHTIRMLFNKVAPLFFAIFLKDNPINTLVNIQNAMYNPEEFASRFNPAEIIMKLNVTEEERSMLLNNKAFYKIMCSLYSKFQNPIPTSFKRILIQLNNGTINVITELENQKLLIQSKQTQP